MPVQRTRLDIAGARGVRYGEVPDELLQILPGFLEARPDASAVELKPGVVWRRGEWCLKRFRARGKLADRLRGSPASRSAELHFALPVATPRPLLALERGEDSLLVAEFVEGTFLQRSWEASPAAREQLPAFLAKLNSRGWFHGDLHARNLIWNGREWVLIDLEAVRPRLHGWWRRRRVEEQWGRLLGALQPRPGLREAFESYLAAMELGWPREAAWRRVERRAQALAPQWQPRGGAPLTG